MVWKESWNETWKRVLLELEICWVTWKCFTRIDTVAQEITLATQKEGKRFHPTNQIIGKSGVAGKKMKKKITGLKREIDWGIFVLWKGIFIFFRQLCRSVKSTVGHTLLVPLSREKFPSARRPCNYNCIHLQELLVCSVLQVLYSISQPCLSMLISGILSHKKGMEHKNTCRM